MKQQALARWLKLILVGLAVCGLAVYGWVIPSFGRSLASANPEFAYCYYPWLVFLWITAIPCYLALLPAWKIAASIGADRSFTVENALRLKHISVLAAGDAAFFLVMNAAYLLLNMSHPGILLLSLLVVFAGVCVSVVASGLATLVEKAALLQEQSDWTI